MAGNMTCRNADANNVDDGGGHWRIWRRRELPRKPLEVYVLIIEVDPGSSIQSKVHIG